MAGYVGGPKKPVAQKGAMKSARRPGISPGSRKGPALGINIPVDPQKAVLPIIGFNANKPAKKKKGS